MEFFITAFYLTKLIPNPTFDDLRHDLSRVLKPPTETDTFVIHATAELVRSLKSRSGKARNMCEKFGPAPTEEEDDEVRLLTEFIRVSLIMMARERMAKQRMMGKISERFGKDSELVKLFDLLNKLENEDRSASDAEILVVKKGIDLLESTPGVPGSIDKDALHELRTICTRVMNGQELFEETEESIFAKSMLGKVQDLADKLAT